MKNFWDNIFHASASETVLENLKETFLTQSITVRFSDPGNLERLLNLDDRPSMDHLLTPSFFVDTFKEPFDELAYIIQCLGNLFACFLQVNFLLILMLISSQDLKFEKLPAPLLVFCQNYARCNFSIVHSLTQMYETDKNKKIVIFECRTK